ncbi:hypothetical protein F5Y16DRAFT_422577 [Xylariaceae sp. FL0255]|nr:hypothetical protein F5Y16DRAFT_422577 [Xylariaceae sp. FL0255]
MAEKRGVSQFAEEDPAHGSSVASKKMRQDPVMSETTESDFGETLLSNISEAIQEHAFGGIDSVETAFTLPASTIDPSHQHAPLPTSPVTSGTSAYAKSDTSDDEGLPYCTADCLLGLVGGGQLDLECPNVALHQGDNGYHLVSHEEWLRLLNVQLKSSIKKGVKDLDLRGATGALLKMTLLSHGYTFVAKATPSHSKDDLKTEEAVYKHCFQDIQGLHVPVFLGLIDLSLIHRQNELVIKTGAGPRIVEKHYAADLMAMSFAGDSLYIDDQSWNKESVMSDVKTCLLAIHERGILHGDAGSHNIMFDANTHKAVVIDFNLALPSKPVGHELIDKKLAEATDDYTSEVEITSCLESLEQEFLSY